MTKKKYEVQYKIRDRKTGNYIGNSNSMPSREVVEAESEANAIAKLKESIRYKIGASKEEWEIFRVLQKS